MRYNMTLIGPLRRSWRELTIIGPRRVCKYDNGLVAWPFWPMKIQSSESLLYRWARVSGT
jgi:hypothetical protein